MRPTATRPALTDGDLMRLSTTDPEAFGAVFDRHAAAIHRYLSRRAGTTPADDLTAETFLTAFTSRATYDLSRPDALPWLYGIAANLLRGHQRSEIRQYRALARTGVDPALAGPEDSVPAQVTAAEHVRALAGALARLTAGEREVLTLVSQAQLSYPEVAEALDIPIGTVRSRLHSARKRIRSALPAFAATLTAVVAAVVVLVPVRRPDPGPGAAQVLRLAAAEARRSPDLAARPDQFVYAHSRVARGVVTQDAGSGAAVYLPPVEQDRRIWVSVDGSRDGLVRQGGTPDTPLPGSEAGRAYESRLPTEPVAMRDWLYRDPTGGSGDDVRAFDTVADTLREQYVSPASVAAMFEAAATIPGTEVVRQADLAGRRGIAVSRTGDDGLRHDLIFDSGTYRFLGERQVATTGETSPYPKGAVIGWTALLQVAVVDEAGQVP
ncbi:CU044_5270 family protein [Paractinoplanes maris]|uniref:CU044_5270 family protein n=1 Tax=Paractinoplanes maris TaxID=1734446 RepID=UPI002021B9F0|nr:CU044_5270 family protein [Actinoplanes maris]